MTTLKMFDISSNNPHPINWKLVKKAGYQGVIIKATEGTNYTNPYLREDSAGARSIGIHIGYYHFAHPDESSGPSQASFALKAIEGLPRDIGLSLDLEDQGGFEWSTLAQWAKDFLQVVTDAKVEMVPLYVNENFLDNLPGAPFGHKLWLASPNQTPRRKCWMWQKSWTTVIPGIDGVCDIDQYNG